MDSMSPGPLSRCTSTAAAIMVSVRPVAFWNNGCTSPEVKQERTEATEEKLSVISVISCSSEFHYAGKAWLRKERGIGRFKASESKCPQMNDRIPISLMRTFLLLTSAAVATCTLRASEIELTLQTRDPATGKIVPTPERVDPKRVGVIAVDVWNCHSCSFRIARWLGNHSKAIEQFALARGRPILFRPCASHRDAGLPFAKGQGWKDGDHPDVADHQ